MAEALSDKTIEIVKSTGSQSKALTATVIAYTRNIDDLGVLVSRIERITQKHCGLNMLPEHYHFVAESLLGAIKEVLGEAATEEVLVTWGEAYWFLADVLMAREASIYSRLSAGPGDRSYRISVKREARPGVPPGIVSNWLHDQAGPVTVLKVAPPAGEFSLNEKEDNPVVVSSGVGLKPMVSMLEHVVHSGSGRPLWYVHGAENGRVHAMGMHVRDLAAQARNVTVRTFYNVPDPGDQAGRDYDERGLIHRQLARPRHADRGGRVLPLRPAAVPARDGRRHGAHQHGAQPHPLRVLRSRRRAAGGLKVRSWPVAQHTHLSNLGWVGPKNLPGADFHEARSG